MMKKKILAGLAVLGLASAPVMAQVASPAIEPAGSASELGGGNEVIAYALIAGIAAMLVLAIADSDGSDQPVSP